MSLPTSVLASAPKDHKVDNLTTPAMIAADNYSKAMAVDNESTIADFPSLDYPHPGNITDCFSNFFNGSSMSSLLCTPPGVLVVENPSDFKYPWKVSTVPSINYFITIPLLLYYYLLCYYISYYVNIY